MPESPKTSVVAQTLLQTADSVAAAFKRVYLRFGPSSRRLGGVEVLKLLKWHGLLTVPQIARIRKTSRQNIQIVVNGLKAENCVQLIHNQEHKRSCLVRITEAGEHVLQEAQQQESRIQELLGRTLGLEEMTLAIEVLRKVEQCLAQLERPASNIHAGRHKRGDRPLVAPHDRVITPAPFLSDPDQAPPNSNDLPVNLL